MCLIEIHDPVSSKMAARAAILKLVFETVELMSRIGIQKLFMGISFEKMNFSVNYYWKNGEREKKRKKEFPSSGIEPAPWTIPLGYLPIQV